MKQRFKVFISSTYRDLKKERLEAVLTVLKLGHVPVGMELFIAGRPSIEIIEEAIQECDVYVLICGKKYGSIYVDDMSYTDYEFEYAKKLGKPMFSIVQDKAEPEKIDDKQKLFQEKVLKDQCGFFNSIATLKEALSSNLSSIISKQSHQMKGYYDCKDFESLHNLKMIIFEFDFKSYSLIESILQSLAGDFDHGIKIITETNICEVILEKMQLANLIDDDLTKEVFVQENLRDVFRNITTLLKTISVQQKDFSYNLISEKFYTKEYYGVSDDRMSIINNSVQELLENRNVLKEIISSQNMEYTMHKIGGGSNEFQ